MSVGEYELSCRVGSVGGGGPLESKDLLAHRLQQDMDIVDDNGDDTDDDFELDDNGSVASLDPVMPDKNAHIRMGVVAVCGMVCGVSFSLFLFLVPFQIDPSVAALLSDFVPTRCSVINASVAVGMDQERRSCQFKFSLGTGSIFI